VSEEGSDIMRAMIHRQNPPPILTEPDQVLIGVYQALMIKELIEDPDGQIFIIGTLIQRIVDDPRIRGTNVLPMEPFFQYRINEWIPEGSWIPRKMSVDIHEISGMQVAISTLTMSCRLPVIRRHVLDAKPFRIFSAEVLIELTSRMSPDGLVEYRPNYLALIDDLRSVLNVRDPRPEIMDQMIHYDFVTTGPTLEYTSERKEVRLPNGDKQVMWYTPKMRVTFYLTGSTLETFFSTFMPILLASSMSVANHLGVDEEGEYLSNSIAIGLSVIFVLPQIANKESFSSQVTLNDGYILTLFSAMILSSIPNNIVRTTSVLMMMASMMIPLSNVCKYIRVSRIIRNRNPINGPLGGREGAVLDAKGEVLSEGTNRSSRNFRSLDLAPVVKGQRESSIVGLSFRKEKLSGKKSAVAGMRRSSLL
jgi:hypothetical protein